MEKLPEEITKLSKTNNPSFRFFIDTTNSNQNYLQEFLCLPKLPVIGSYNRSEYSFGNILLLVKLEISLDNEKVTKYKDFHLPKEIMEYLNVKEELKIDNNSKVKSAGWFYPKNKIIYHFIISSLPMVEEKKKNLLYLNIVPHSYYLGDKDTIFEGKKTRNEYDIPICMFNTKPYKMFINADKGKKGIALDNLRTEYNSIHTKKGGLALSPNNLQFNIDIQNTMSQFNLMICQKEREYHSVFYYITLNNEEYTKRVEDILDKSNTLKEVITSMTQDFSGTNKDIIDYLNSIFN